MRIKLGHKAMMLVGVPLTLQLILLGILFVSLTELEAESARTARSKEIMAHVNRLVEGLVATTRYAAVFGLGQQKASLAKYRVMSERLPLEMAAVSGLLKGDRDYAEKLRSFRNTAELWISFNDESVRLLELGREQDARFFIKGLPQIMIELSERAPELTKDFARSDTASERAQSRARQRLKVIVIAGALVSVGLAGITAAAFNYDTIRRLAILMDNTNRMETFEALLPPVTGEDELAELDGTFHRMADSVRTANEKLRHSEARIRSVIESMPVGILTINSEGRVEIINPALQAMFALVSFQPEDVSLERLFCEIDILGLPMNQTIETAGTRANGTCFPCEISLTELRSEDESRRRMLTVEDLTAKKEVEQLKRDFMAMVSHDLRSPLTSLTISIQAMLKGLFGALPDRVNQVLSREQNNVERLMSLVNDLLDVEKMESGKFDLLLDHIDLDKIFRRSVDSIELLAQKAKVEICFEPTGIGMVADGDRLTQVLVNLISNAIKFSPEDSKIVLFAVETDDYVEVRVQDSGRGIPEEARKWIFERYRQVEAQDATVKKGSGLGLAICKGIVESHKGEIGVTSVVGQGSTFWFRIPLDL